MSEDPKHPWGSGATTYSWTPEVRRTIELVTDRWPLVRPNSYVCHPWCGWARFSVDYWWTGGRGDPIPVPIGRNIREFLMDLPGKPLIRHTIFEHQLWTRWGGYSYWSRNDHTGSLRHLHVTYLKD